ncbi:unnamed protein product [Sphagnum balticum]
MAWRKKSLDFVGQIRGIIITHCCDLNSQGIAAECCNSTNFRSGSVPFATKAHVQPTSEGLRGILFSRSVCHQVLHSLKSDLQSRIRIAIVSCLLLWRIMFGIASLFVSLSEGMAEFGFLALAAGMVAIGGVVTRARYIVNPDTVYRIAMRKLNTSAAVLEVMGAPLTGTDVRAYVMSGGGLRIKNFRPRLGSKNCFLIFPITGGERHGLVSIEVKKKKGQYDFKLLAVDIPTAGAEHRVYVIGDEAEYRVGGGLISVLRDPIVKAMAAQKEFQERDEREDEEYRQQEAEETHTQDMLEKLEQDAASEVAANKELTNPQVIKRGTEAAKA